MLFECDACESLPHTLHKRSLGLDDKDLEVVCSFLFSTLVQTSKSGEETHKTIWLLNSAISRKADKMVSFSWKLMVTRKIFASKQVIGLNPMHMFNWTAFNSQWACSPWVTADHKCFPSRVKLCCSSLVAFHICCMVKGYGERVLRTKPTQYHRS